MEETTKPKNDPQINIPPSSLVSGLRQQVRGAVKKYLIHKNSWWKDFPEVFKGLFSVDDPTRKMSFLFLLSLLGLLSVLVLAFCRYRTLREARLMHSFQYDAYLAGKSDPKKVRDFQSSTPLVTLGTFSLELESSPSLKEHKGGVNLAELEIVLLCDGEETKAFLDGQKIQARNQALSAFYALSREELMSRDGKKRMKTRILKALNSWLTKGRVEDVYFSKIIID